MPPTESGFPGFLVATIILSVMLLFFLFSLLRLNRKWNQKLDHQRIREYELLENDRQRIACDLHDGIAPVLTLAGIQIGRIESVSGPERSMLDNAVMNINQSIQKLGEIVMDLLPSSLQRMGLDPALRSLLESYRFPSGMNIEYHISMQTLVPDAYKVHIYRIVQELLQNAVKHSKASHLNIRLVQSGTLLKLNYKDDGAGMPERVVGGTGLLSIISRVEILKGRKDIVSKPGKGTQFYFEIPLPSEYANGNQDHTGG